MTRLSGNYILFFSLIFFTSCLSTDPILNNRFNEEVAVENPFGFCQAGYTKTDREYELLNQLGCEWLRVTLRWSNIEKRPGEYDYYGLDLYVDLAEKYDKKIIGVLCYDVPWLYPNNKTRRYISPDNVQEYLRFVEKTVTRYKGRIDAFEIWNEPNGFFWRGTDKDFFYLFSRTVSLIKEIDPSIIITTPGLLFGDAEYLDKMFRNDLMTQVDVISFHPYAMKPEGVLRQIRNVQRIGDKYGYPGSYWISEVGYPTGGLYPFRTSMKRLPDKIVKTHIYALLTGIDVITWYELFDHTDYNPAASEEQFGLVYKETYKYKNGAYAYRFLSHFLAGSNFLNNSLSLSDKADKGILAFPFLKGDSHIILILWSKSGEKTVSVKLSQDSVCTQYSTSGPETYILETTDNLIIGTRPLFFIFETKEPVQPGDLKIIIE